MASKFRPLEELKRDMAQLELLVETDVQVRQLVGTISVHVVLHVTWKTCSNQNLITDSIFYFILFQVVTLSVQRLQIQQKLCKPDSKKQFGRCVKQNVRTCSSFLTCTRLKVEEKRRSQVIDSAQASAPVSLLVCWGSQ